MILKMLAIILLTAATAYAETDYTSGSPWLCSDLDGNVTAETPASLKDDFALYVNKDAILALEIPEGGISAGPSADLSARYTEDMKNMFAGDVPQSHDARLAYNLYRLVNDWDSRNALGVTPLKKMTDAVEAVSSLDELTAYFTVTPAEARLYTPFKTYVSPDLNDASKSMLYITRPDCFLGDPARYREWTPESMRMRDAATVFFTKMLIRLGYSEEQAARKIENGFAFENTLMSACMSLRESKRPDYDVFTNHHYSRAEMRAIAGKVPVVEMLEQADGYPAQESFVVREPDFIAKLSEIYTEENLPLIRDYLILHGINTFICDLDWDCNALSDAYESAKDGEEPRSANQEDFRDISYLWILRSLGWPMARLFVERYVNPEDKTRITSLVDEIVEGYRGILMEADFLSEETRAAAVEKLNNMGRQILYPDDWSPYSFEGLDFAAPEEGGTYWDAMMAIRRYERMTAAAAFDKPSDRTLWGSYPMVDNCEYDPHTNTIFICAGYARGDNYSPEMTREELYAKLGTAIGHEISHAFDSFGARYDKNGSMVNWWTDEDLRVFTEKNNKLAAYYDAIHPWEGADLNGELMTGEACADMTSFRCMLRLAAGRPDFDYDAFFRAYAAHYLSKESLAMILMRLEDMHPMHYLRINTVLQQFDEFLDFYGIRKGDGMYLSPEDRVAIW